MTLVAIFCLVLAIFCLVLGFVAGVLATFVLAFLVSKLFPERAPIPGEFWTSDSLGKVRIFDIKWRGSTLVSVTIERTDGTRAEIPLFVWKRAELRPLKLIQADVH